MSSAPADISATTPTLDETFTQPTQHTSIAFNANSSTESVDVVQNTVTPVEKERQLIEERERALRERAIKRMERREVNHQKAEEICRIADELLEKKEYAQASIRYVDATNLWPSNSEFYLKLTKAYIYCERFADAAHAATRSLSFDPKSPEARYTRGVARLEQGLLDAAKIDFETVIAHDPLHASAHTSLGRTLSLLQATKLGSHVLSPPPEGSPESAVDFAFPRYDDEKLELAEPSDSSDCRREGNGVPCRFYNHEGCARREECEFSHAPDEKSVRDDLGKNVCLYYLLDKCKFGDIKCVYSHSRECLPKTYGWWNDKEQVERVKGVIELAERRGKEKRATDAKKTRQGGKREGRGQRRSKSRGGAGEKATRRGKAKVNTKHEDGEATSSSETAKIGDGPSEIPEVAGPADKATTEPEVALTLPEGENVEDSSGAEAVGGKKGELKEDVKEEDGEVVVEKASESEGVEVKQNSDEAVEGKDPVAETTSAAPHVKDLEAKEDSVEAAKDVPTTDSVKPNTIFGEPPTTATTNNGNGATETEENHA